MARRLRRTRRQVHRYQHHLYPAKHERRYCKEISRSLNHCGRETDSCLSVCEKPQPIDQTRNIRMENNSIGFLPNTSLRRVNMSRKPEYVSRYDTRIQLDWSKWPKSEAIVISEVDIMVVSRVARSKARHSLVNHEYMKPNSNSLFTYANTVEPSGQPSRTGTPRSLSASLQRLV